MNKIKNNDKAVKEMIHEVINTEQDNKIDEVINKQIVNQEDDFKAKLEAKRQKKKLNNSDIMDQKRLDDFNVIIMIKILLNLSYHINHI